MMSLQVASSETILAIAVALLLFVFYKVFIRIVKIIKYMVKPLDREFDDYLKSKGLLIAAGLMMLFASCAKEALQAPGKERPKRSPDRIRIDTIKTVVYNFHLKPFNSK